MSAGHIVPEITVVIATYNRASLIGDAVRSVLAQEDAPSFEFLVVDNNSTDETRRVVEALIPESGGRLRYVFEGQQGVSYARNAGVAASSAPILAFTDDDVRVRPTWLAAIARTFAANPWADFIGGKVLPRWPRPVPAWLTSDHWSPLALVDYGPEPRRVDFDNPICLVAANLAVRRTALDRVGGFDPFFQHARGTVSACEDYEWQLRALRADHAGLYAPDMVIEAEVQPNRLDRAYHRRWHFDHGRVLTRLLGPAETFDARMLPGASTAGRPTLLGAAPWVYRQLVTSSARALAAWLTLRPGNAFLYECQARTALGHIAGRAAPAQRAPAA